MINILLTSAGRRAYIVDYFKSCKGVGKVHASNSVYTIALQRADSYFISPLIYDPDYIPSIIQYCKLNHISAVLSLFDIDLLVLAKNTKVFESNGIKLVLAPASFIEICNDKWKTYLFLKSINIPTPKTFISYEELNKAIDNGCVSYPVIMKPRWGMASMGIYKVENERELIVFTEKCKRDIFNSYLKYESSMTADSAIVYQELLVGKEYGIDVINDIEGNYVKTFAKQKVSMRSGETDIGLTVDESIFVQMSKTISMNSKHQGLLSVDCFISDNKLYVIEMNCRISGHYPISHMAGVNYPQVLVDWLLGKGTDESLLTIHHGVYVTKDLVPTVLNL